jgi:uncharacterized protein YndB with AHSA1/START domain
MGDTMMGEKIPDAVASKLISAPAGQVWNALTDPRVIKKYFLGTEVTTTWQVGEPITFKGEWQGKHYEDKGVVLSYEPEDRLSISHYSPLTGLPDVPENYHSVEYCVEQEAGGTRVTITQGNNRSNAEADESAKLWDMVLQNLKELLEPGSH